LHFEGQKIGKRPLDKQGHLQVYLDRIPRNAYRQPDTAATMAIIATNEFSLGLAPAWMHSHRGSHKFLVALAKNDNVLYRLKAAAISVHIK
jgi:hypothetical protein